MGVDVRRRDALAFGEGNRRLSQVRAQYERAEGHIQFFCFAESNVGESRLSHGACARVMCGATLEALHSLFYISLSGQVASIFHDVSGLR